MLPVRGFLCPNKFLLSRQCWDRNIARNTTALAFMMASYLFLNQARRLSPCGKRIRSAYSVFYSGNRLRYGSYTSTQLLNENIYSRITYLMRNKSKRSRWFIHSIITTAGHSITTAKNPRIKVRTTTTYWTVSYHTFHYRLQFRT